MEKRIVYYRATKTRRSIFSAEVEEFDFLALLSR